MSRKSDTQLELRSDWQIYIIIINDGKEIENDWRNDWVFGWIFTFPCTYRHARTQHTLLFLLSQVTIFDVIICGILHSASNSKCSAVFVHHYKTCQQSFQLEISARLFTVLLSPSLSLYRCSKIFDANFFFHIHLIQLNGCCHGDNPISGKLKRKPTFSQTNNSLYRKTNINKNTDKHVYTYTIILSNINRNCVGNGIANNGCELHLRMKFMISD